MHLPEWLRLAGLLVVAVGFALRLKPTLVVVTAALLTGLLAGIPLLSDFAHLRFVPDLRFLVAQPGKEGLIDMLGRAFADNRLMTLFIITLPAIALSERFGLQRQSAKLIGRIRAATVGRLLIVYQLFRVLMGILGLRVNGHPTFVRPLVYPMALAAARIRGTAPLIKGGCPPCPVASIEELSESAKEEVKAASAASENYGNFYGQNLSPVQPGILLVFGVLKTLGYTVSVWRLVAYAIPIATLTVLVGALQFRILGKRLRRHE
jgi:uncharacterized membrane protein